MDSCMLPIEVCERVIDFAGSDPDDEDLLVDYPTLLACSLVCQAWLPRARSNIFHRVVLRTDRSLSGFLALAVRLNPRVQELELGLPLLVDTAGLSVDASHHASFVSPALARVIRGLRALTLSRTEWLYPRVYISILGSYCATIRTLDLFHVFFPTGGDLARILWSFPLLLEVECTTVIVKHRGMARLPPPPTRRLCSSLERLALYSCSSTAPYILKAAMFCAPPVASLSILSSFASWHTDDFLSFSAFVNLKTLVVVMTSPTSFSPLPASKSLVQHYADVTRLLLSNLALSGRTTNAGIALRSISIAYEPGRETRKIFLGRGSDGLEYEEPTWTYSQQRSPAAEILFGALESQLCDGTRLRHPFGHLESLKVKIWDTYPGQDDEWWHDQAAKWLPALHSATYKGVFNLDVRRGWDYMHALCGRLHNRGYMADSRDASATVVLWD